MDPLRGRKILLGVTASIAAYKAADLASRLVQREVRVDVLMTPRATALVGPITFQTLTRRPVLVDLFASPESHRPEHIQAAEEADAYLIAPATADVVAKLALGIADDAVTTTALAITCPLLVAPAMNGNMYAKPVVQRNLEDLRGRGTVLIDPEEGTLACGYEGMGRLASIDRLLHALEEVLRGRVPEA